MAKDTKMKGIIEGGRAADELGMLLGQADENDLRLLAALCLLSERDSFSAAELAQLLGMVPSEVEASLKFWRGAGVLQLAGNVKKQTASKEPVTSVEKPAAVHRGGAVERSGAIHEYTSTELAQLMEQRRVSADLVDEAQKIMGKIFRVYDTGILVGLVDQLGFAEEAVLAILAYTVRQGKKTLRYAERMALAFYDEGITETDEVLSKISRMEQSAEAVGKIKQLFGFGGRELTANEKKLFAAWIETYGYDLEVIRLAYDLTVDAIQKPVPKYAGTILESWFKEGLRTAEDVRTYLEAKQAQKSGTEAMQSQKSYDVDEFFEAAIKRGLKDYHG